MTSGDLVHLGQPNRFPINPIMLSSIFFWSKVSVLRHAVTLMHGLCFPANIQTMWKTRKVCDFVAAVSGGPDRKSFRIDGKKYSQSNVVKAILARVPNLSIQQRASTHTNLLLIPDDVDRASDSKRRASTSSRREHKVYEAKISQFLNVFGLKKGEAVSVCSKRSVKSTPAKKRSVKATAAKKTYVRKTKKA